MLHAVRWVAGSPRWAFCAHPHTNEHGRRGKTGRGDVFDKTSMNFNLLTRFREIDGVECRRDGPILLAEKFCMFLPRWRDGRNRMNLVARLKRILGPLHGCVRSGQTAARLMGSAPAAGLISIKATFCRFAQAGTKPYDGIGRTGCLRSSRVPDAKM
jgi:hypothetical protein